MDIIKFTNKECPLCGGNLEHHKVEEDAIWGKFTVHVSGIDAEVCSECGEIFYSPEDAKMLQKIASSLSTSKSSTDFQDSVLNLSETATLLRVSNQSIYNMINDGRLKAKKVGREWRFLTSEVRSLLDGSGSMQAAARNGRKMSPKDLETIENLLKEDDPNV